MTTFPYKGGKSLAWDFTVVDTVCAISTLDRKKKKFSLLKSMPFKSCNGNVTNLRLSTQFINSVKTRQTRLNLPIKINLNIGHQQLDAMIRTQHFLISTLDRKKCFPSKAINEIHLTIVTLYRRGVKLKLVPFRVVESIQDLILGWAFKT